MARMSGKRVRESWASLAGDEALVSEVFYRRLFAAAPEKAKLFANADMELQRLKFAEMITDIVRFAHRPEALEEDLHHLADRHIDYGVAAADYDAVGGVLLASLEEVLGERFTPEIKAAWSEAYTHAAQTMLARHRRKGGR